MNPSERSPSESSHNHWTWLAGISLVSLGCLYIWILNPDCISLLYDDGIYLLVAKALSQAGSYQLIGIEGDPLFYKYPPLFPMLLSGLDHFLASLPQPAALKIANILISLTALALLYRTLCRVESLPAPYSLGIVLLLGTLDAYVDVSVELMSEPLFLLITFLLIMLANRLGPAGTNFRFRHLVLLSVLSALCVYTRTMGVVLVMAIAVWLWFQSKRKAALGYFVTTGLLCLPWMLWASHRPDTTEQTGNFLVRTFQETYGQSFFMDIHHEFTPVSLYAHGAETLFSHFSSYFFGMLSHLAKAPSPWISLSILALNSVLMLCLGLRTTQAFKENRFSLTGLYASLYLLILPFWSYTPIYPRFLLPILPFLMAGLYHSALESRLLARGKTLFLGGIILLGIGSNLFSLSPYLHKPFRNTLSVQIPALWQEFQSVIHFIRTQTPQNTLLYSDQSSATYLYAMNTHRHFTDFFLFLPKEALPTGTPSKSELRQLLVERSERLYEQLQKRQVRYLIAHNFQKAGTRQTTIGQAQDTFFLLQRHPEAFKAVMQSPDGWITVYRFQS
ncbi:MAG TPA: hypothetical protein V6C99_07585 [Oculatellaceae cyanobacterium]|jgi:hypothetical protein